MVTFLARSPSVPVGVEPIVSSIVTSFGDCVAHNSLNCSTINRQHKTNQEEEISIIPDWNKMNSAIVVIVILLTGDNLLRLFNGEITKKRCARNIVVYGGAVIAGLYGGYAGEAISKTIVNEIHTFMEDTLIYEAWDVFFLPGFGLAMGVFVGTIVGAVTPPAVIFFLLGGEIRNDFGDFNTSERETITKPNVTLGDAYKFLGLKSNAKIKDVNSSYKRLAKKHHPDKGGSYENWHKLKDCLAVIKQHLQLKS